jgi:hypothetical protein
MRYLAESRLGWIPPRFVVVDSVSGSVVSKHPAALEAAAAAKAMNVKAPSAARAR